MQLAIHPDRQVELVAYTRTLSDDKAKSLMTMLQELSATCTATRETLTAISKLLGSGQEFDNSFFDNNSFFDGFWRICPSWITPEQATLLDSSLPKASTTHTTLLQVLGSIVHSLEAASLTAPTSTNADEKLKAAEQTIADFRKDFDSLQRVLSDSEHTISHVYDLLKSTQVLCPHVGAKYR